MAIPEQKTIPFARDGQKNGIPTAGASTDEGASYQMGFPPRTMRDDASAVPPTGEDMNGILNQLSQASIYQQAGGFYPFNGTYAQAIGGYPRGALVLKSTFDGFWQNTVEGNMTDPDNGGAGWKSLSGSSSHTINELIWAALPITDAGLHLLDGSLLLAGGVYDEYVQYVAGIETSYPDAFVTETQWQDSVATYGSCGKFVVSRTNGAVASVRLPKVSDILQGTTDLSAVGDLVEAGLPNIVGNFIANAFTSTTSTRAEGAFSSTVSENACLTYGTSANRGERKFTLDASRSSPYYKDSVTKPTPQTIKSLLYICVATSVKTPVEVDIDEIATDLNEKADKDFANVTDTAKGMMTKMAMPSDRVVSLTPPPRAQSENTYSYIAQADGFFGIVSKTNNQTGWIAGGVTLMRGDSSIAQFSIGGYSYALSGCLVPVRKNDVIVLKPQDVVITDFNFIYAEGAN